MSNPPTTDELRDVERAIDLRAQGHTWDQVATRLRLPTDQVRQWPHRYADLWASRMAVVQRDLDQETIGQARAVLRHHLWSENLKGVFEAARILLDHARRSLGPVAEVPPSVPEHVQIADHLEGLSHDQLHAYLDSQLARLAVEGVGPRQGAVER